MSDYIQAMQQGFEAAQMAAAARQEINDVFENLKNEILSGSDGKLLLEIKLLEELPEQKNPFATASIFAPQPKKYYTALTASNPLTNAENYKELARWRRSKAGYPCSLIYGKEDRRFGDRTALEAGLAELLKDPSIGEILYNLIHT